jgi:sporulation protein YlmC with PRC-barrel domain
VIWYHTRIRTPWWGLGPNPNLNKPLFIKEPRRNIPEGSVALEEGAEVIDAAGQTVGEIEEVYAEPESNRVTHLLISRGTFSKDSKLIPTAWVEGLHENTVRLTVGQKVINELPEPEEHPA